MKNKIPTQKQQEKLWEHLGLHVLARKAGKITEYYRNFAKPEFNVKGPLTLDLNNLFEHAISKMWICDIRLIDGIFWSVSVSVPDVHGFGRHGDGKAEEEKLELAIFWAIWQVFEK